VVVQKEGPKPFFRMKNAGYSLVVIS
jgi:hypothetical protein